jgi:hypothetical protein
MLYLFPFRRVKIDMGFGLPADRTVQFKLLEKALREFLYTLKKGALDFVEAPPSLS